MATTLIGSALVSSRHHIKISPTTMKPKSKLTQSNHQHPELEDFCLVDTVNLERQYPNGKPFPIVNEFFEGHAMCMFRTSDADSKTEPEDTGGTALNDIVSNHFRPKRRRFEIQLQGKFKKTPESPIFFVNSLDGPIEMGVIQRTFVKAALRFVKAKNPGFTYNLAGFDEYSKEEIKEGKYEKPYLAFPFESSLNKIVVSKQNETPPSLGVDITSKTPQPKAKDLSYNTEDTYTFAFWSTYIDFITWRIMNLPALRPFDISSVNSSQPFTMELYTLKSSTNGRHLQCDKQPFISFELGHLVKAKLGEATKKWMAKSKQQEIEDLEGTVTSGHSISTKSERFVNDLPQEIETLENDNPASDDQTNTGRYRDGVHQSNCCCLP
jgi:hypothetical protein